MSSTPKLSMSAEDRTLVLRLDLDAHPLIDKLWSALPRAAGHPQLMRTGYAVLVQAVAQTIADGGPDMWAEARALNDEAAKDGQS